MTVQVQSLLRPDKKYTFRDYFKLSYTTDEVLAYFGYQYQRTKLILAQTEHPLDRLAELERRLQENIARVPLNNETARREFLIAPIVSDLLYYTNARLRVEEAVFVNKQLQGNLDYFLEAHQQIVIIEAKNSDLQRGFTQLAVELIALDHALPANPTNKLYGAITIGEIWQFGILKRQDKTMLQDIEFYRVPTDLESLLRILIAIIK
jgi:hypothetical protein